MEIAVILVLICCNACFALAEIAFVSARREVIEERKSQGSARAAYIVRMMEEPDRFLSSIQVGITLIGIVSGAFGAIALADHFASYLSTVAWLKAYAYQVAVVIVVTAVTYLSIVIGELVPKTIALRNPERIILFVAPFHRVFTSITFPLVSFLSGSTKAILRVIGVSARGMDRNDDPLTQILGIAKMAAVRNMIDNEQARIIANTVKIKQMCVSDIMIGRDDMKILTTNTSPAEALVQAHIHHHTRYPLLDDTQGGAIIGYVNFKDIVNVLRINPTNPSLKGICRPLMFVDAGDKVPDALHLLIRTYQHIAGVRRGQAIVGLITLEDILETIVGDIKDEYDVLPEYLYEIAEGRIVAGGGVNVAQLHASVSARLPDEKKPIAQWLLDISHKPLKVESRVVYGDIAFVVRKVRRSKIHEVIIEKAGAAAPEHQNP